MTTPSHLASGHATTPSAPGSSGSATFSLSATGSDIGLLVHMQSLSSASNSGYSATYNGVSMNAGTEVGGTYNRNVFWLVGAASGTNNLVLSYTGDVQNGIVITYAFYGNVSAISTPAAASPSGYSRSVTVSSATGDLAVVIGNGDYSGGQALTPTGATVERLDASTANNWGHSWVCDEAGAASVALEWGVVNAVTMNCYGTSLQATAPAAPVLSVPTASTAGSTTATVGCTSDTASGTLYVVVTTSATQPSAAQIKASTDHADAAAAYSSSDASVTAGANTFDATGLTSGLTYFAHFVQNANSADSDVLSTSAFYPGTYRTGSDITVTGWTVTGAATHAAARNENSASDSEYSTSPTLSGTPVSIIMGLAQEMPAGSYTVQYRCRLTTGTGYAKLTFMDGSNVSQGATQDIAITSSFTTYDASVTLTGTAVRVKEELWI